MGLTELIADTKDLNVKAYKRQRYNLMQYHNYNKMIQEYSNCYQLLEVKVYEPLMKIYEGK